LQGEGANRLDNRRVSTPTLADRIDAALPQTQCTRCGYADCCTYAEAIAAGEAAINQCPPGGAEGVARLAAITGHDVIALNPVNGAEGPRKLMFIDEAWCIGCTLCIKACPVDCIVGAPKLMHTIIEELCTGCELCLPACPVDCIAVVEATPGRSGWDAWSEGDAQRARARYATHRERRQRDAQDNGARLSDKAKHKLADLAAASTITDTAILERKRAAIEAAMQRARERAAKPA
jgi:Na+-translocating ferredoxin:NAD+ oxidoreductase subunit B